MDILNFISWLKNGKRFVTSVDPARTLLPVGLKDGRRDDDYLAGAISVADFAKQLCNDTYRTGIYDDYPWTITPTMLPTCTNIIDTPAFPTAFAANLVGYKVAGSYDLSENDTIVVEYIGTVENVNGNYLFNLPWKTSGSVGAFVNVPFPSPLVSAFANGATIADDNGDAVPAELMTIAVDFYAPGAADLYLVIASNTAFNAMYAAVSFEFEFLDIEGETLKFTIY